MKNEIKKSAHHKAAMVGGISIILMAVVAFFSYGYVYQFFVRVEDIQIIKDNFVLFRSGVFGWVVIIILDLLVTCSLYIVLKRVHEQYALFASLFRLLYTCVLCIAVSYLISVVTMIQRDVLSTEQLQTSLLHFQSVWSFGLIIFGLHLFFVGLILFQGNKCPKILSVLVMIAGISYTVIHLLSLFFPEIKGFTLLLEKILMAPMAVGELSFGIWLLVKGIKKSL